MHILSPETDNCPSWISRKERMTVENISWSISMKECCRPRRGSNPRPPGLQLDTHPTERATEAGYKCHVPCWFGMIIMVGIGANDISALDKVLGNWVFWSFFTYPFLVELSIRICLLGTLSKIYWSESEYFTGDTSIDFHSPGPMIAKTSL